MAWEHLIRPVLLGEGAWRIANGEEPRPQTGARQQAEFDQCVGKGIAAIHSACTPEVTHLFHHIEGLHELWNALATRFNTQNSRHARAIIRSKFDRCAPGGGAGECRPSSVGSAAYARNWQARTMQWMTAL